MKKKYLLCNLRKFEKILDTWRTRKLPLFGKCQIIDSLIVYKLLYFATTLAETDQTNFKQVHKNVFSFLWEKGERTKRKTLI